MTGLSNSVLNDGTALCFHQSLLRSKAAGFNRRMRKTACPVVWEGGGAQSPPLHPIKSACRIVRLKGDEAERRGIRNHCVDEMARFAPPAVKRPAVDVHGGHSRPMRAACRRAAGRSGIHRTRVHTEAATQGFQCALFGAPQQGNYLVPRVERCSRHQIPLFDGKVIRKKRRRCAARLFRDRSPPRRRPARWRTIPCPSCGSGTARRAQSCREEIPPARRRARDAVPRWRAPRARAKDSNRRRRRFSPSSVPGANRRAVWGFAAQPGGRVRSALSH